MNEDKDEIEFSYEVFDRQLDNFCRMLSILVDAWEDYSPQELTFDIRSLCTKATRLCYMAEKDMVLQHNDIAKQRKEQNETHEVSISIIVMQKFTPLMAHIMEDMKKGKQIEGKRMKVAPLDMTRILPKLNEFFETDELGKGSTIDVNEVTKLQKELLRQVKPTHIPGVKPVERLWNLFQLYSMACYLMLHFRQLSHFTNLAMSEEQTTRLFEMSLQEYQEEPKGISDIDRYFTTLEYDNNGKQLSVSQLLDVRKTLKDEVPENLRLDFMKYIRDTQLLGAQLAHVNFTAQEYLKLVSATVKWHIIEQEIYDLEHPEGIPETLPNEVFYKVKDGKYIDMQNLKAQIANMLKFVTRKNHWFCVWCVLNHNCMLQDNQNFEAFATQMMTPEWFGDIDDYLHFSGDNLRDYRRYFSEIDYPQWDEKKFKEIKDLYNMTKWSDKLLSKFQHLCITMNGVFDKKCL